MKVVQSLAVIGPVFLALIVTGSQKLQAELFAGAASCDITLPIGAPILAGLKDVVTEIGDPLFARLIYLRDSETNEAAVIVAMDCSMLLRKAHNAVQDEISLAVGVPRERIVVNASHTHSGAYYAWELEELLATRGHHVMDLDGFLRSVKEIGKAAAKAKDHAEAVSVSVGTGQMTELAFNRRLQYTPSSERAKFDKLRRYPQGVFDPTLGVIRFDRKDGTAVAVICNFACHATVYAPKGVVSGSFPGVAMRRLEAKLGDQTVAMFLQGCGGNVSPGKYWPGQSLTAVGQAGNLFAERIESILENKMERLPPSKSQIATAHITLPFVPLEGFNDLADLEQRFWSVLKSYEDGKIPPELAKFPTVSKLGGVQSAVLFIGDRYVFARNLEELSQYDLFAWNYGPLMLAVLPGESFVEFALEIRDRSHHRYTLVASYNDGTPQYIPDAVAFEEGGYEPGPWCYSTPETGQNMVDAAVELVNRIPAVKPQ